MAGILYHTIKIRIRSAVNVKDTDLLVAVSRDNSPVGRVTGETVDTFIRSPRLAC